MKAELIRQNYTDKQVTGVLRILNGEKVLATYFTLELAWKNNERKVSCIPKGTYTCVARVSPKYGRHYHVTNVPNRDLILIHHGNYHTDILGCILIGKGRADLNKDGIIDVTQSKIAMAEFVAMMPDKFDLTIN
jgi:hypothetical protein